MFSLLWSTLRSGDEYWAFNCTSTDVPTFKLSTELLWVIFARELAVGPMKLWRERVTEASQALLVDLVVRMPVVLTVL